MKTMRKFAYAAVLAVSILSVHPTLAVAEDVHGVFTLTHEVHWQKRVLQAGDYAFTLKKSTGRPTFLMVRGLKGTATDAALLVSESETLDSDEVSRLVLVSRDGQSFVSSMDLPAYDMTLRFSVPDESSSK
jgi:hypothetical protein